MVTGREYRDPPPASVRNSGGDSNSSEWALWEPSGLGWAGPGLARALWIRMWRGMAGGWLGGSVVGLGGSVCTAGTGPEEGLGTGTLGGDGGMWDGGGGRGRGSAEGCWAAGAWLSSLSSPTGPTESTGAVTEVGSEVGDSEA